MKNYPDLEERLLQLLKKGDEQAFITIFDCYHRLLYSLAYRYLESIEDAEDAVQYTFMMLWERRHLFDFSMGVRSLLFTILKNYILNELRHRKVVLAKYHQLAQEEDVLENNFLNSIENQDFKKHLLKAINRLPEQKRMICFLKIEKGLTNKEIADKMQITLATVKSHYTLALKMLRKEIEGLIVILLYFLFC